MSEHKSNYESKIDHTDYTKPHRILHDIRNMKVLKKEQIDAIRKMTADEKMEVIFAYNSVTEYILEIVNNM